MIRNIIDIINNLIFLLFQVFAVALMASLAIGTAIAGFQIIRVLLTHPIQ